MNEIKAQQHIKWLEDLIKKLENANDLISYNQAEILKKARYHFKSLITKDYEHGDHGV